MTPINFVTFLLSLYLVDYHYETRREHMYPAQTRVGLLPGWLHRIIYRPQPYARVGDHGGPSPAEKNRGPWHYHTKQRKLMKMEASDAFEMRKTVLVGLLIASIGIAWGVWRLAFAASLYLAEYIMAEKRGIWLS
jgi:hypothetical protein